MQSSFPSTGRASRVTRSEGAADYIAGPPFSYGSISGRSSSIDGKTVLFILGRVLGQQQCIRSAPGGHLISHNKYYPPITPCPCRSLRASYFCSWVIAQGSNFLDRTHINLRTSRCSDCGKRIRSYML